MLEHSLHSFSDISSTSAAKKSSGGAGKGERGLPGIILAFLLMLLTRFIMENFAGGISMIILVFLRFFLTF
jgi:hypothetical protein